MRFFQTVFASAALVAAALALEINDYPKEVEAGSTYTVTYSPKSDTPTTFLLRKGKNEDLDTITTLTESAVNGEFTWNVDPSLPDASDYALEIRQEGVAPNYIGPIALSGGTEATSSASSATASSTDASSTDASSTATDSASTTDASSTLASVTSMSSSVSGKPSASGNGTLTSSTPTGTGISPPEQTDNAAVSLGSAPMALIMGAVAAIAYLN